MLIKRGQVSSKMFCCVLCMVLAYCFVETDLYHSFLGPLGQYIDRDYYECKRYCNFESGDALLSVFQELPFLNENEITNLYIVDYSGRWSSLCFKYQGINQIGIEFQLDNIKCRIMQESLLKDGFSRSETDKSVFGDFLFFYREENKNLQTLIAINPIDNRLLLTCFHYKLFNQKSKETAISARINDTPSYQFNIMHLKYTSQVYENGKPAGIWKTQTH